MKYYNILYIYIWTWIIHGIWGYLRRERPKDPMKNVSLQISNQKKCLSDWWKPLFCTANLEHPILANLPFIQFRESSRILLEIWWCQRTRQTVRGNTFGDMTRPNDPSQLKFSMWLLIMYPHLPNTKVMDLERFAQPGPSSPRVEDHLGQLWMWHCQNCFHRETCNMESWKTCQKNHIVSLQCGSSSLNFEFGCGDVPSRPKM